MDNTTTRKSQNTIIISTKYGRKSIEKKNIICCNSFSIGTLVSLKEDSHLLLKESVAELKAHLQGTEFFLVDQYHLINLRYIDAIFSNRIILVNGEKCYIDQKKKEELFMQIEEYYAMQY
ncbi:MAG: LytTR family transcriptional regulator DNA-binding domain-containing protein [Bacteroidales bacterium]